jgi:hypothetical protein
MFSLSAAALTVQVWHGTPPGAAIESHYVILGILAPALLLLRQNSFMAACAIWSTTSFAWFAKRYANASDFGI